MKEGKEGLSLFESAQAAVTVRGEKAYVRLKLADGRILNVSGGIDNAADEFW